MDRMQHYRNRRVCCQPRDWPQNYSSRLARWHRCEMTDSPKVSSLQQDAEFVAQHCEMTPEEVIAQPGRAHRLIHQRVHQRTSGEVYQFALEAAMRRGVSREEWDEVLGDCPIRENGIRVALVRHEPIMARLTGYTIDELRYDGGDLMPAIMAATRVLQAISK